MIVITRSGNVVSFDFWDNWIKDPLSSYKIYGEIWSLKKRKKKWRCTFETNNQFLQTTVEEL
jgi:hypothetical protein